MKIVTDSMWNFASIVIPAVIALPVFGWIARLVGVELFGIFTLSFAIVGYASIFDLGLSRAIIREVAIQRESQTDRIGLFLGTGINIVIIIGSILGCILFFCSNLLTQQINVSFEYQQEVKLGFQWLSACIPLLLLTQVWLEYFEGLSNFRLLSILKIITSLGLVLFPLMFCLYDVSFSSLAIGFFCARLLSCLITGCLFYRSIRPPYVINRKCVKVLFNHGGWMTISSIIGPIMIYFDRFILSALIGAKQASYYHVPSELIVRLLTLPSAVARTLFPQFTKSNDSNKKIYINSIIFLGLTSVLVALPIFILAEKILVLWMGAGFAGDSALVLKILLVGFVFHTMAQVPFIQLQAKGFAKAVAIIHIMELLPYLFLLFFMIKEFGIIGASITWLLRVLIDFLLLFKYSIDLIADY